MAELRTPPERDPRRDDLESSLEYDPVPLKFGTSGRRGLVIHLTQLEVYINALAELQYLQSLPASDGGVRPGDEFYFAADLRPSSTEFAAEFDRRGELAQAIARAVQDAGMTPVYLGTIPTPALAHYAWRRRRGSIMITGSHIPFERNGYKINTATRELLKQDEMPIQNRVDQVRARLYAQPFADSPFDRRGMFKTGHQPLNAAGGAAEEYLQRYATFFAAPALKNRRVLVYQHSAVGCDLLTDVLRRLGAHAIPAGRSDTFVPIDTENIDAAQLRVIETLAADAWRQHGPLDAIVSTDGDSDRPLLLAVEPAEQGGACRIRFFNGERLGMVAAEFLGADAVVVPITCSDAIDRGPLKDAVQPRTRIGSPFVVAGMQQALERGHKVVCGWEANGGFLTGSSIERDGRALPPLPTRDAFLPLLSVLLCAAEKGVPVAALFEALPRRFSRAGLMKEVPHALGVRIVQRYSPGDPQVKEAVFAAGRLVLLDEQRREISSGKAIAARLREIRNELSSVFTAESGFGGIEKINYTDGVRLYFSNGDIAHVRPSGNADELRIYAVADSVERAEEIVRSAIGGAEGLLGQLLRRVR